MVHLPNSEDEAAADASTKDGTCPGHPATEKVGSEDQVLTSGLVTDPLQPSEAVGRGSAASPVRLWTRRCSNDPKWDLPYLHLCLRRSPNPDQP